MSFGLVVVNLQDSGVHQDYVSVFIKIVIVVKI
jgi:hypothetical protein